ncbi:hypothetical protein [Desulfosporosinus shakirovi]|uniref:hypothetical protein n=1 Tax=Desulfosporosinus shakirovi TaxID=2885154 RepID=UPI001E4B74F3|nr:hypothetical protein [Desulfosporosinus sp. SRJS8]MCB8817404.1 hypothetical protein [Desulfosporosinus sp. SRJS8]
MDKIKQLNIVNSSNSTQASLASVSMRELFLNWLVDGNVKKYPVGVILSCLDKISDYAIQKKISTDGIWEYMRFNAFKPVYNKLLEANLLRVTDKSTYKVFIVAGQLYLKFLKEKPWIQKVSLTGEVIEDATIKEQVDAGNQPIKAINPEDVIAWLVTQPNAKGTLYLEHVVRQYMRSLRSAPMKLSAPPIGSRDVFACRTVSELDELWSIFKTAPNYKKVNSDTSGMFSAGLGVYRRYLESIAGNDNQSVAVQSVKSPKQEATSFCSDILLKNLEEHFPKGFRINSPIEIRRFRRFVMEDYGEEIMLSDEELTELILSCGTLFEGKVYIIQTDATERIKSAIDSAANEGAEIVFYSAFYEQNEDWLFPASIISAEMLKNTLMSLYPQFIHKTNCLAVEVQIGSELAKIGCEVLRVWGDNVLLSYEQLSERLPYVPVDKIKYVLSQNGDFIWNSEGVYTYISKVDIADEEHIAIADFVATAYLKDGYSSLSDIPLSEIAERNYELSLTAVQNAAFAIVLADKYDKRGKIIIRKGDILDALSIMKEHCRSLEKCSLRDLLNFERELTGETHRWIPMEAGYAVMIRADEDTFLAEKYVRFNVLEIDNVLDQFVEDNYLPLRSITTFSVFPDCGQAWNLFLLESYCRRFSERFRFEVLAVNSKNAGVIVRKNCTASYIEIMADAVAVSSIMLEKAAIEDFLCNNGYIGKRSYTKTNELIELANAIRERRN